MAITKKQRKDCEEHIYKFMDAVDKTKTNTEHYKKIFAKMSDAEFERVFKNKKYPIRFYERPWEVQPKLTDIKRGLDYLKVPMTEKVRMPFFGKDEDGNPVLTKVCDVIYTNIKKEQQFITKKNSMSTNIEQRDMKTGLLTSYDKNGKTSDKENEAMVTMGLNHTVTEFNTIKADSMNAKNAAYAQINATGVLNLSDLDIEDEDSLSKNLFNVYTIGAMLYTNILSDDYILPYTMKERTIRTRE